MTTTSEKLLLSVPEALATLGIGRSAFYEMLSDGRITSITIGRRRLVPREALTEFVQKRVQESAGLRPAAA